MQSHDFTRWNLPLAACCARPRPLPYQIPQRCASPMSHGAQEPGAAEMRRCVAHILRCILGTNREPTIQSICIDACQPPSDTGMSYYIESSQHGLTGESASDPCSPRPKTFTQAHQQRQLTPVELIRRWQGHFGRRANGEFLSSHHQPCRLVHGRELPFPRCRTARTVSRQVDRDRLSGVAIAQCRGAKNSYFQHIPGCALRIRLAN